MPIFIVENLEAPLTLSKEDSKHLKVRRTQLEERITLCDNAGTFVTAKVESLSPLSLVEESRKQVPKPYPITVNLALIDQDRLEWAVQKLTELNIRAIRFLETDRSQKKQLSPAKLERLKKIALAAQKQSERGYSLKFLETKSLHDVSLCHECLNLFGSAELQSIAQSEKFLSQTEIKKDKPIFLFIGPEGGWSEEEISFFTKNKVYPYHMGNTIFRAETAAIVLTGCLIVNSY